MPSLGGCSRCHSKFEGIKVQGIQGDTLIEGCRVGELAGARATPEDWRKSVWGAYRSINKSALS